MKPSISCGALLLCAGFYGGCSAPDSGPVEPTSGSGTVGASTAAQTSATIPGLYFFQIDTQRGPIVGNWSFHADGTFFSVANGTEVPAGTWTSDGTHISLVQTIPYGNTCNYGAPLTATGFASKTNPSTEASCTFNHLRPNPRKDWYALKLQ